MVPVPDNLRHTHPDPLHHRELIYQVFLALDRLTVVAGDADGVEAVVVQIVEAVEVISCHREVRLRVLAAESSASVGAPG